jgi:hypothetical protein
MHTGPAVSAVRSGSAVTFASGRTRLRRLRLLLQASVARLRAGRRARRALRVARIVRQGLAAMD